MSSAVVLIIDDKALFEPTVIVALAEHEVKVLTVSDIGSAKRFMLENSPAIIVCAVTIGGVAGVGCIFCKELRAHHRFANVPLVLIAEALTEDIIRAASDSGAHGLVAWPVSAEALRRRLSPLLKQAPAATSSESGALLPPGQAKLEQTKQFNKTAENTQMSGELAPLVESSVDDKLKKAQQLLAMVLHNLKTSNLLEVVELEDVPRVVSEMTRKVCGEPVGSAGSGKEEMGADAVEVEVDLGKVFRFDKQ